MEIQVGKFCSLGSNLRFVIDRNHKMSRFSTYPFHEILKFECEDSIWGKETPIIGNDVWIGSNVTIYSGVVIGDGVVIGGNSVVAKSLPPYSICVGNPCVVKKYRFVKEIIEKLLKYKWWDRNIKFIQDKLIPIIDGNIEEVIKILESN